MKTLEQLLAKTVHHTATASSHLFFLFVPLQSFTPYFWFSPTYNTTPFRQYFRLHLLFLNYISWVRLWVNYDLGKGRYGEECRRVEWVRPAIGNEVQEDRSFVLFSTVYTPTLKTGPGMCCCSINVHWINE